MSLAGKSSEDELTFSHLPANTITIIICCAQHGRIPNKLHPNNIGMKCV
jgi:hypothetical protein